MINQSIEEKEAQLNAHEISSIKEYIENFPKDVRQGLVAHFPFDQTQAQMENNREILVIDHQQNCTTNGKPSISQGKVGNALMFNGEYDEVYIQGEGLYEMTDEFSIALWINTTQKEKEKTQTIMGNAGGKNSFWRG